MDKEIRDKHYEVIGKLQALETLAKFTSAMPSDRNTESLLIAARGLLDSAVLTAMAYAGSCADRSTARLQRQRLVKALKQCAKSSDEATAVVARKALGELGVRGVDTGSATGDTK